MCVLGAWRGTGSVPVVMVAALLLATRASAGDGQGRRDEHDGEKCAPVTSIFDTVRRANPKANTNILARTLAREARQSQEVKWAEQNLKAADAAIDAAENEIRTARFAQRLKPLGPFGRVSRTGFPRLSTPHTTYGFCVRRRGDTPPKAISGWEGLLGTKPHGVAAGDPWRALPGVPGATGASGALGAAAASSDGVVRAAAMVARRPRENGLAGAGTSASAGPRSEPLSAQLPSLLPSLMPPVLVDVNPRGVGAVELAAELPVPPPPMGGRSVVRSRADKKSTSIRHSRPPELLPSPRTRRVLPSAEGAGHIFCSAPKSRLAIPGAGGERDTYWEMHRELCGAAYIDPLAREGLFGAPPPVKGRGPGSWLGVG